MVSSVLGSEGNEISKEEIINKIKIAVDAKDNAGRPVKIHKEDFTNIQDLFFKMSGSAVACRNLDLQFHFQKFMRLYEAQGGEINVKIKVQFNEIIGVTRKVHEIETDGNRTDVILNAFNSNRCHYGDFVVCHNQDNQTIVIQKNRRFVKPEELYEDLKIKADKKYFKDAFNELLVQEPRDGTELNEILSKIKLNYRNAFVIEGKSKIFEINCHEWKGKKWFVWGNKDGNFINLLHQRKYEKNRQNFLFDVVTVPADKSWNENIEKVLLKVFADKAIVFPEMRNEKGIYSKDFTQVDTKTDRGLDGKDYERQYQDVKKHIDEFCKLRKELIKDLRKVVVNKGLNKEWVKLLENIFIRMLDSLCKQIKESHTANFEKTVLSVLFDRQVERVFSENVEWLQVFEVKNYASSISKVTCNHKFLDLLQKFLINYYKFVQAWDKIIFEEKFPEEWTKWAELEEMLVE